MTRLCFTDLLCTSTTRHLLNVPIPLYETREQALAYLTRPKSRKAVS